ncbi:MAG: hypothetical protein HGB17_09780 [Syntrophobacteraceae bacterium]|nr:hypothetical protein [Syntrophobacteraceae bacterium]
MNKLEDIEWFYLLITASDLVLINAGSSAGRDDRTAEVIARVGTVYCHGLAIRPGKPTILARIGRKLFWGLPGQPVSALMICRSFVVPSVELLQGCKSQMQDRAGASCRALLIRQLPSVHGRTDYVPVVLSRSGETLEATPVFGNSAMISTLGRADGYVVVPEHSEGMERGREVTVHLFSQFSG